MPLKTEGIEEPTMNMTPMIDVVFLLIIFFMVASRIGEQEREFDVNLPTVAAAQPLTSKPDEIVINVFRDGRIVVRGEERTLTQLEGDLEQARQRYADQAVLIRGEGEGRYQRVVDVLVACHRARIKNFSLATELKSEQ
jgi:biopolymer transport protein ExbD